MQAITFTQYGSPDGLHLETVAKPTPTADQVLIRVHATSLNYADTTLLTGNPFLIRFMTGGLLKPKIRIIGSDVAGVVEAVGAGVKQFKVGDEVFADLSAAGWGGLAEYACASEKVFALKPATITFEDAAAAGMAAVTALQGIRDKGQIRAGEKVLIYGASGGVGSFAVQIAKSFGANVTAVCSTRNVETARTMGADRVVDYTREDITQSSERFDLIIAANGKRPLSDYRRILTPNGRCVVTGGGLSQIFGSMFAAMRPGKQKMSNLMAKADQNDLRYVGGLLEAGKVKPVIDRCYPLSEAAEAFRYLIQGHARGKIVITVISK